MKPCSRRGMQSPARRRSLDVGRHKARPPALQPLVGAEKAAAGASGMVIMSVPKTPGCRSRCVRSRSHCGLLRKLPTGSLSHRCSLGTEGSWDEGRCRRGFPLQGSVGAEGRDDGEESHRALLRKRNRPKQLEALPVSTSLRRPSDVGSRGLAAEVEVAGGLPIGPAGPMPRQLRGERIPPGPSARDLRPWTPCKSVPLLP